MAKDIHRIVSRMEVTPKHTPTNAQKWALTETLLVLLVCVVVVAVIVGFMVVNP